MTVWSHASGVGVVGCMIVLYKQSSASCSIVPPCFNISAAIPLPSLAFPDLRYRNACVSSAVVNGGINVMSVVMDMASQCNGLSAFLVCLSLSL